MSQETDPRARAARLAAVQVLYELDMIDGSVDDVLSDFLERRALDAEEGTAQPRPGLMRDIARGAAADMHTIDEAIDSFLSSDRGMASLDVVLRAVLRAATYELMRRPNAPARAIISEYCDITGAFFDGPQEGVANAVLDRLARQLRAAEFAENDPNAA